VAALLFLTAAPSHAQLREPIGRFVADVRAASVGLPTTEGWTPAVPEGTQVPARTLGYEFGAHVYLARFRSAALGLGATWLIARGSVSPPEPEEGTTAPPASVDPTVTTRLTSLSPQLSLNFGHSLGWSYISAGLGRTRVEGEAVPPRGSTLGYLPIDSDWVTTVHFGGGARWFLNDHLGVGFDVRWRRLRGIEAAPPQPAALPVRTFSIAAGISLK
jgi:hypothetical protein